MHPHAAPGPHLNPRSTSQRLRMAEAAKRLQARGVYPSADALAREMGLVSTPSGRFRRVMAQLIGKGILPARRRREGTPGKGRDDWNCHGYTAVTPRELADRTARVRCAKRRRYAAGYGDGLSTEELDMVLPLA